MAKEENAPNQQSQVAKPAETKDPAPKSSLKQFILAGLLMAGLIVGSASAAVVIASIVMRPSQAPTAKKPAEGAPTPSPSDKKPCEFALENALIVNVYQTQQRRYLSVKPVLVLDSSDALEKIKERQAELQHVLIGILKRKTLEQLDDPDAANSIGREIQEAVNLKFGLGSAVTSVYFTQFVVQ